VTVTEPCVSLSTGTLSDDLRVNYTFGMVLGLDEFQQEQQYFLAKDYLHERAMHGYGTVYGLQVTTAPVVDDPSDELITVLPGMAIDQWGREVVVRSAQCARLGAWLATQDAAEVAANVGPSGELIVYVTLAYAQCDDDLIPLAGQPCSTSSDATVASRIRDSWDIKLSWTPPSMPSWDTDRRLARLLGAIELVPGLAEAQSDEEAIVEAVLALPDDVGAGPDDLWPVVGWPTPSDGPSGPIGWRLPAETAPDALDRILTVWVTRARPLLSPWLTEPPQTWDAAILLSTISFSLGTPSSPLSGSDDYPIAHCDEPDDSGRPYLLHTRLMQEMRWFTAGGGIPAPVVAPPEQLATLTVSVDPSGTPTLQAWFHTALPVSLTEPVQVASSSGAQSALSPSAPSAFSSVWTLTVDQGDFSVADGEQIAVTFDGGATLVGDATTTLAAYQTAGPVSLLDALPSGDVVVYADVVAPTALPSQVLAIPTVEFVTITQVQPLKLKSGLAFELWFHTPPQWPNPTAVVKALEGMLSVVDELTGQELQPQGISPHPSYLNLWRFELPQPDTADLVAYLRFVFDAEKIPVEIDGNDELSLVEWMKKVRVEFIGWDGRQLITAYARVLLEKLSSPTPTPVKPSS
jgi:hypothetical protein